MDNKQVIALERDVVEYIRQDVLSQPEVMIPLAIVTGGLGGGIKTATTTIAPRALGVARKVGINATSPGTRAALQNLDMSVDQFIGHYRNSSIR